GNVDLDSILCHDAARVVARDNTVTLGGRGLPIAAPPGRRSGVGLTVIVRQHLDGRFSLLRGTQRLGTLRENGRPGAADRDRGTPRDVAPPTPPGIRVRTTAVRPVKLSRVLKIGSPSESK